MFLKQKIRIRHALAFLLSVAMVFSMFAGNTVSVFAASSIALPSWAETRLYFHTIGNDTTDSHAWAVMETTATSTGGTPSVGSYSSGTGFRVFLPETAKNSDGTYLVYNNYGSDITIGGRTIGSKQTGYVSSSANTVKIGSGSTYSLKIYTSNAEENIYFTHSGSSTKNKNNGTITSASGYVSSLGLDWSKGSKSDAVVTNGNVTLVQADGTIDTSQTLKQIKGRGNTTWKNTNKKSWNFTLNDEKVSVGGMKKGKKYSLLANFQDPSLSRNRLLYDLADSVGVPYAADSRYADVYMDGLYIGSYQLTQKNDSLADLNDPTYASDGSVADAEFMIELACSPQGDDFEITPGNGSGIISVTYPEVDTLTSSQKSALKNFIKGKYDELYNAICNSSKTYTDLSKIVDVESLAKVYLINELSKNYDAGVSSFYLVYENGKFYASPVWDYDNSLGNANTSPSVASDYKSPSGNWCKVWKGNGQSYSGNFLYRSAKNSVVLDVACACWFGESQNDTTSFVYNINKFANSTSTQVTLGKNTGLLSKTYYAKVLKSSATNNYKKWSIVPNNWCSGHSELKMYKVDYDDLYSKLDTMDYSVSSSVSLSSSSRSYDEYCITTSSKNGGQYDFAADYMISRAAWMSVNMLQTGTSYSLTGNKIGWTSSLTDYKLTLKDKNSKIYGITGIDASLVTGYFKLNDGSSYIGPSGSSDVAITTETTYGSEKAYCVTGSISNATKAYSFSNPDGWSKVSVYYRPSDGKIWIANYSEDIPELETIAAFKYDNTDKVAGEDLNEYADGADTYTYLATTGNAKLTGSITGAAKKHLEWSSDAYTNENGTNAGIVPIFGASASNNWTANANVTIETSTKGYKDLSMSLQLGATKKGPANYAFYVTDGNNKEKIGTYSLSGNKTMYQVSLDIPDKFADKGNVRILVQLENTTAVNGNDIVGTASGEFGINNIVIEGKKTGVIVPTTVPPTITPTVPIGTNKAVVYYKRSATTSWSNAYIHYKTNNGKWTTSPGVQMTKISAGYWSYTIDLGTETGATLCFNNGSGSWDSNSSKNYSVGVGAYLITDGSVTSMDATPTPTVSATPTATPTQTPKITEEPEGNTAVVYYKRSTTTSWSNAYIHYKTNNGKWTTSPGVKMTKISAGYWSYTIDLGTETGATLCFNNGSGSWDSNSSKNYSVGVGAYLITNGSVTSMDATPTPTVSATPTASPTQIPVITEEPEGNTAVVYYKRSTTTSWSNVYIHYKVNNGKWTTSPGVKMKKISAGYWSYTIDLGTQTGATVCFNNGSGSWDSNGKSNYTVGVGASLVTNGSVSAMDATATPTLEPTPTPINQSYVTVDFDNSVSKWENVYAYVWNNTEDYKVFSRAYVSGKHYIFNITGSYKYILFKNTEDKWDQQTADLLLPEYTTSAEGKCFKPYSADNKSEGGWETSAVISNRKSILPSVVADKDTVVVGDAVKFTMTAEYENGSYKNRRSLQFVYEDGTVETLNSSESASYTSLFDKVSENTFTYTWTPSKAGTIKVIYSVNEYEDHGEDSQAITLNVKAASNTLKLYYKNSSWSNAYVHYKVNNNWTTVPGMKMQASDRSDYTWMYTIDLGDATSATFCFNDGNGKWANNNNSNYTAAMGVYGISGNTVTAIK